MNLVSISASGVTIAMFVSQLSIITELRRASKSHSTVPILQFLVSFLSSVLWLKYGLIKADQTVTFVNTLGTLIAAYILGCFWYYSSTRSSIETRILVTALAAVIIVSLVDHATDPAAVDLFSLVCCFMTLVFLGSPLSQIGNVVRMQDASVLLPSVTWLAFANNVLWSAYGYIHADPYMLFPNSIGAGLCAVQLALIAYYGRAAAKAASMATGSTLEMTTVA